MTTENIAADAFETFSTRTRLPASIEVTARQALESDDLPRLFPRNVQVYIPDLGTDADSALIKAAIKISNLGYEPVPHIAARRLTSRAAFEDRIKALVLEAGVRDVLVIGGGLNQPLGDFASTLEVLQTGVLDRYGIKRIGIAGHPEGSPDFSDGIAAKALRLKAEYAQRTDANMRIVTQFGFDADIFISWAMKLRQEGILLPIHVGLSGPTKVKMLIKYAAMCGVGNSLDFLKKRTGSMANLLSRHSPEDVAAPIEAYALGTSETSICQFHVFPFGGLKPSAAWLRDRESWPADD